MLMPGTEPYTGPPVDPYDEPPDRWCAAWGLCEDDWGYCHCCDDGDVPCPNYLLKAGDG